MLTKIPALAVLSLLPLSCAASGNASSTPPPAPRGTPSPAMASPSVPPGVEVVRGGFANLYFKKVKDGYLRIEVKSTQTVTGTRITATYERNGGCTPDPVTKQLQVANCQVLWTVRQNVKPNAFTFDDTLAAATLTDTLKGKRVSVTWRGYGEVHRKHNANGNLLVELRDAKGIVQWGADKYTDPDRTQTPSQIYRRLTPKT